MGDVIELKTRKRKRKTTYVTARQARDGHFWKKHKPGHYELMCVDDAAVWPHANVFKGATGLWYVHVIGQDSATACLSLKDARAFALKPSSAKKAKS